MKNAKQLLGSIGLFLMLFGMCLADSESLIPTLVCMGLGIIMMLPLHKEGDK
jgi:hypothetical protein